MTTFYLVRHGACDGLGETLWGRAQEVCLNEQGKTQAQRVAERFERINVAGVYSSPLERALETAAAIGRAAKLEVKQNAAFNEIDFGDWSGKSFADLARDQRWLRFNTHRSDTRIPGGEFFLDVQARVIAELDRLAVRHLAKNVVIVSHADVIKTAIGYVAGAPIDLLQRFEVSPGSVSIIATDEHETKLLAVNSGCEPL